MALPELVQEWPTRRQMEWVLTQHASGRLSLPHASDELLGIVYSDRESFLERALQVHICTFPENRA